MTESRSTDLNPEIRRIVDAARDVWTRRLIDHSRRNSLLFYRNLKVGTLDLTAETEAAARLLAGEKLAVESLASAYLDEGDTDPVVRTRAEAEARQKARSALVALQRKALSNLEEKGIETLHLAMGMATWPAADGGRPYNAPLLLLPARIETHGRTGDDLRLEVTDEPQLNPVLLYVLEEDHAIRVNASSVLNDCGAEDKSGRWCIDPEGVFTRIEQAATTVSSFNVIRRVILANFQFEKMAMVEDLKRNGDAIASSVIVAAIAGHANSRQNLAQAAVDIEPAHLDERPASDDYLVLDADSTQHRCIVLVGKGQNGVVEGPPGTGKSQTISNLIAQSVAEGRRVLFVAEKHAALDAVIKRLAHVNVGLGHLVLDLHGASVSRKEVMTQLAHSLQQIRNTPSADGAEAIHREFDARRKQLNEHARRVNEVRQAIGLSVNQMIGKLLRLPTAAKSALRLRDEALAALKAEHADKVKQCILEGAANPTLLLGTDPSPWNNANITDGRRAQEALDLAKRASSELWPRFERMLGQTVESLGMRLPENLDKTADFLALLRDTRKIREQYGADIFSARPGTLAQALQAATGGWLTRAWAFITNAPYRVARKRLIALRASPAGTRTLREEALAAENVLCRWDILGAASDVPVMANGEAELANAYAALSEAIKKLAAITKSAPIGQTHLEIASWLRALAADERVPYQLPGIYAVQSCLRAAGLAYFLDELREQSVAPKYWVARFEYVWLYSTLEQVLASDPGLASFNGRTHEQIVAEFIRLDRERIHLAATRVQRLHAERAIDAMNQHFDQANLVQTEVRKKSRHMSVRKLLARAPDVLTRIAPCWVASPLSVSQLLDGDMQYFDIVVFDEASQILQEEAIPALYRAKQVVVAGDRHQLPPTTFFATAVEGEDDISADDDDARDAMATATAAIGGFESLLDTLEAFLPSWFLEWHYRSEDERLITFSNTHIYTGRLVTFPSARGYEVIRHILVPHDPALGSQEESSSREVEEVVRQVLYHAETRSHESLGVITMGIKHANRIQAALDRALLNVRSELSDFFSLDREERFFIKNLETVQGDERDAIILSIGYGKASNGDLPHRFGPLTQDVGYRRLNVAVTRAKRRMCVISSFSHDEIDLSRSGSRGVRLLKLYLEYAANGGTRLPEGEHAGEVALNPFEADVRDALKALGIKTRPQFGASRYRIDLVAMHPEKPGRPVLAIECDGASYHSGATARDRDRLRQAHLQRLGWCFHRVWSTDWFYKREQEAQRAVSVYKEAVRMADLLDADGAPSANPGRVKPATQVQQPIARQRGARPLVQVHKTIDQYSDQELDRIVEWIVSDGLLRTDEEIICDIFKELPFQRLGSRIRERLLNVVQSSRRRQRRE